MAVKSIDIGKRVVREGGSGPSNTDVRLEGFDELFKLLTQLPDKVNQRVLRGAPAAGAKEIRNAIKDNAQRFRRTGRLAKSVKSRRASSEGNDFRAYVYFDKTRKSTSGFYWHFLEYGTVHIPANPFVRPAIDTHKAKANEAMAEYIVKRFEKEAAKLAR